MEPTRQPLFARKDVAYLSVAFYCLLWRSVHPVTKGGYKIFQITTGDIPSKIVFAGYHFPFTGLLPLLLAVVQCKPTGRLSPRRYDQLALLGLTQTSLQYIFFYIGLAFMTGVERSVMSVTGTFLGVLLVHFIYHSDKLSYNKALSCILGFAGVTVVNFSSGMDFDFNLLGDGSVVMAAFILSVATLYGKRTSQAADSMVMTGYQLGDGGLALVIGDYAFSGTLTVHGASSVTVSGYLTLLSLVTFALWSILFKHNRVGMIASFNFLIPVSGAVLSAMFLDGNTLEQKRAVALALVCSGVWQVSETKRRRPTSMPGGAVACQVWNREVTTLNGRG